MAQRGWEKNALYQVWLYWPSGFIEENKDIQPFFNKEDHMYPEGDKAGTDEQAFTSFPKHWQRKDKKREKGDKKRRREEKESRRKIKKTGRGEKEWGI